MSELARAPVPEESYVWVSSLPRFFAFGIQTVVAGCST
jgi:hypothetical protein